MRLRNLYGLHRLAMLGVALLVLSLAVFTLSAALAHLRSREGTGGVTPPRLGPSGGGLQADSPWRVDEGQWSVNQTDYAAGKGGGSLVADSPHRDIQLSFRVIAGSPPTIPDVFFRERDEGYWYSLSATTDRRVSLARSAGGTPNVVASSQVLDLSGDTSLDFNLVAEGPRLRVWLNGSLAIDYTDPDPLLDGRVRIRTQDGTVRLSDLSLAPLTH